MYNQPSRLAALLLSSLLLAACGGGGNNYSSGNHPPNVAIDAPQPALELSAVTLTATGEDADGDELAYEWRQTGGTSVELLEANTASVTFHAPKVANSETLQFEVEVSDGKGGSDSVTTEVVVDEANGLLYTANFEHEPVTDLFRLHASDAHASKLSPPLADTDETLSYGSEIAAGSVSSDRRFVAYVFNGDGDSDQGLRIVAVDGSRETVIIDDSAGVQDVGNLAWSPATGHLAFTLSIDDGDTYALFVVDIDENGNAGSVTLVSGEKPAGGSVYRFAWSPDGEHLAIAGDLETNGITGLYVVSLDEPGTRHTVSGGIAASSSTGSFLWAPDSDKLVFVGEQTPGLDELFLVPVDANPIPAPQPLSGTIVAGGNVNESNALAWSPDSRLLAFQGDLETNGRGELFVIPFSTSGVPGERIKVSGDLDADKNVSNNFAWSPADRRLAFRGDLDIVDITDLYIVSFDDNGQPAQRENIGQVSAPDVDIDTFQWSVTGCIAYRETDGASGLREIFVACADDSSGFSRFPVSGDIVENGAASSFAWSPDGRELAFIGDLDTNDLTELFVVSVSPGEEPAPRVKVSPELAADAAGDVKQLLWFGPPAEQN